MRQRLVVLGYTLGWALLRALPERLVRGLFDRGADLAARRGGKGARRLRANLARVTGLEGEALESLVRKGMRSYARYWLEVFRLPVTPPDRVVALTHTYDEHHMREALSSGRGLCIALPHMGNWDHAGAWAVLTGAPFTTVAERLEPAELFDRFVAFREGLGMEVLPLTGGTSPYSVLEDRLRGGGMLCLLADRDLTRGGVEVSFFGETAKMPAGPARLCLATGAALVPATLSYDDGGVRGLHIRFHPPVEPTGQGSADEQVAAMTQGVADAFAAGIAEHPEDWHMLQRLWLADLEPRP